MQPSDAKYDTLIRVLDSLRDEAPSSNRLYHPERATKQNLIQPRARAYLHLFLKVRFGLLSFAKREQQITEGPNDGGIDAFHIDADTKTIYCIQAKFRDNAENFENKQMGHDDLLKIQLQRITTGEQRDVESRAPYNEHIRRFQRTLSKLKKVSSYKYRIVLLGNTSGIKPEHIERLCERKPIEHYGFQRVYTQLIFPLVQAAYYGNPDLVIRINHRYVRQEKDHLDYVVTTRAKRTGVKLLFVPAEEIGRVLFTYKNSILTFNPRSFLELQTNPVNKEIRNSVVSTSLNEFALFNNGITMISDECNINPNIGKKGWAEMELTNPHIVNGGQTAYVLSRIYEDIEKGRLSPSTFNSKEVLLRVIELGPDKPSNRGRANLIDAISKASNAQSKVDEADRRSNEPLQIDLQARFFEQHGLFYERKRGEFADGINQRYVRRELLVRRDLLMRVALSVEGKVSLAKSGIRKFFTETGFKSSPLKVSETTRYVYGYEVLRLLTQLKRVRANKGPSGLRKYGTVLRYGQYALISVAVNQCEPLNVAPDKAVELLLPQWKRFERWVERRSWNSDYFVGPGGGFISYYKGATVNNDIAKYRFKLRLNSKRKKGR